jgi:glycerate dehydrogenase
MEKIVITDGYTLNPGDLSWNPIMALGQVDYSDKTEPDVEAYIHKLQNATVAIVNKSGIVWDKTLFNACKKLKLILVTATGYNIINIADAKQYGITVCNVPGYSTDSVTQTVFAHILNFNNRIASHNAWAKEYWPTHSHWCHWLQPIHDLSGKNIGIIGYGTIGQKVATIARAFGMNVLHYSESRIDGTPRTGNCTSLEELVQKSDFISLHCPATAKTNLMINQHFLKHCKKTAFLINTSRGQLVNEEELNVALNQGLLAGAALDVLTQEPPAASNVLLKNDKCTISPHIGWLSVESRIRAMDITISNLKAYLAGNPQNVIN